MKYILVTLVIGLVTYGQLIIKHQVNRLGHIPTANFTDTLLYLFNALTDIGILSGLLAALLAAIMWIATVSKYELSSVYPFLAINFLIVPILSVWIFDENMNALKGIGLVVVITGLFIFARGVEAN